MSLLRSAALNGFDSLVADLGGDSEALLDRARISPAARSEPNGFISSQSFMRLLEYAARGLDCPDFGLRLSDRQSMGTFGPLAVAMRNSATIGEALGRCSRYLFSHSPSTLLRLHPATNEGSVLIELSFEFEESERPRSAVQAMELTVGLIMHLVRRLSGQRAVARSVSFRHESVGELAEYRRRFGPRVFFGADVNAIEIAAVELDRPIDGRREDLLGLAESYLQLLRSKPHSTLAAQVSELLRTSVGAGVTSCEEIARMLALHPRTLQRRLREEGTSFEERKDRVRADLARDYLAQRELPFSRLAVLLDYSEQSALTRSCKRWFGKTPRQMRAELLAQAYDEDARRAPSSAAREVDRV